MGYNIAVAGATGAVGREMIKTMEQRNIPIDEIKLLASIRSKGKTLKFNGQEIEVEVLTKDSFKGIDFALFSAGGSTSKEFAPYAAEDGCVVIDNSSAWRMDDNVPLVVPEINMEDAFENNGIIANPNCSTIQMVLALYPIHRDYTIKRVVVSTYQAVSGTGNKAIVELTEQTKNILDGKDIECNVYPKQIAFNALPHIDVFLDNDYTKEEMKMLHETRKIMHAPDIQVSPTAVRIPVFRGHSESINIETKDPFEISDVKRILNDIDNLEVMDDIENEVYPTAIDSADKDITYVGRIRRDFTIENGLNIWVVSDNLRKGAALNAVQILEGLIQMHPFRV